MRAVLVDYTYITTDFVEKAKGYDIVLVKEESSTTEYGRKKPTF